MASNHSCSITYVRCFQVHFLHSEPGVAWLAGKSFPVSGLHTAFCWNCLTFYVKIWCYCTIQRVMIYMITLGKICSFWASSTIVHVHFVVLSLCTINFSNISFDFTISAQNSHLTDKMVGLRQTQRSVSILCCMCFFCYIIRLLKCVY